MNFSIWFRWTNVGWFVVPLPGKTSTSGWCHCEMLLLLLLSNTNNEYIIQYSSFWMLNAHSSLPFHCFAYNFDESSPIDNVFGIQYSEFGISMKFVCLFDVFIECHSIQWFFDVANDFLLFNHKSIPNTTVSTMVMTAMRRWFRNENGEGAD